jgi:hypothetical protein
MIDKIQKGSLAILLWFALYILAWGWVFDLVWPPQVRLSRRLDGTWPTDASPSLPLIAWVAIYAIPTLVVGSLVFLYLMGTRNSK